MPAVSEKQRRAAFAALTVKRGKKMVKGKDYGKGKPSDKMAQMPEEKLKKFTKRKGPSGRGKPNR